MSSNINTNLFSFNTLGNQNNAFEDSKSFKESLQEAKSVGTNAFKSDSSVSEDSIHISNDKGKSSVNYDFSSYSNKNSIAEA